MENIPEKPKMLCECVAIGSIFYETVEQGQNAKSKAFCTLCHKTTELSTSGCSALIDHPKRKKTW